jgi:cardiolipin synthase
MVIAEEWMMTLVYIGLGMIWLMVIVRVILRPHREPASRAAWIMLVIGLPVIGVLAYIFLGETNIGRSRVARAKEVLENLPPMVSQTAENGTDLKAVFPQQFAPLFRLGEAITGMAPVGGNSGHLMADSNTAIDSIVADMNAASDHIHLMFYIWLADNNGLKVVEALKRAADRGVVCRALADGLGSRAMIGSKHWQSMHNAGVKVAVALPIGNLILQPLRGRIDLRNHRKIVVIDDSITYCGSQNCADPEFRVKPKYAPWVDILIRFEGPIARQNQHLFAADWMKFVDENIHHLLEMPIETSGAGFPAQVIATGPTRLNSAMPEMFTTLMYAARNRLDITTPYYVPNESMQDALCSAARRGVKTTIILPARNDAWQVAAASHSYYRELLEAGVKIHEYVGGLLHTKSMIIDDEVTLIGSANMDRRSFELNYENNILFYDPDLTAEMRRRQEDYLAQSNPVTTDMVAQWSMPRRFWNNTIAMISPVL